MAENPKDKAPDKDPTPVPEATPSAADRTRAQREAAAADVTADTNLIDPMTGDKLETPSGGVLADAAKHMVIEAARSEAGLDYTPPVDEKAEARRAKAPERSARPTLSRSPLAALHDALAEHDRGDPITLDDLNPPAPGATERGWSPEVTARHPLVQAEIMAELAGVGGGARRAAARKVDDKIDPTDSDAVSGALREQGFHEVRMRDLRNQATRVASDRLAAAQGVAAAQGAHARLAMADAVEAMREEARKIGHDV